ncbi:uncharacterized protein METZ01_LOCUS372216, partial [marine metagenome]
MNLARFTFLQSLTLLSFVLPTGLLQAEIGLSAVFGDHMVLQRDLSLPVWGWADPGEEITITFADQ